MFYIYIYIHIYMYGHREEGARYKGFELSMIMTSIQRPAPTTRYHTYAIINKGRVCDVSTGFDLHASA